MDAEEKESGKGGEQGDVNGLDEVHLGSQQLLDQADQKWLINLKFISKGGRAWRTERRHIAGARPS